ncbi:TPA: hypothetical protein N0F65_005544 [Lagenidium giganteum]|uniref:Reverse transcriptase Ty1/copia-type domain-containing protein n=1 Tax=Lagenidium giganteum TaxID=4803 RepID=A0AAV2YWL2_9STRA|nr:TPA: hypothetical protein N0F65_005544 [Lagenidium giganteum]
MAAKLGEVFELADLGPVKYLLGIEVIIRENAVLLSQRQYVEDVLKMFHMLECNGAATPEAMTETKVEAPKSNEYLPYRELVGALQYLVSGYSTLCWEDITPIYNFDDSYELRPSDIPDADIELLLARICDLRELCGQISDGK